MISLFSVPREAHHLAVRANGCSLARDRALTPLRLPRETRDEMSSQNASALHHSRHGFHASTTIEPRAVQDRAPSYRG